MLWVARTARTIVYADPKWFCSSLVSRVFFGNWKCRWARHILLNVITASARQNSSLFRWMYEAHFSCSNNPFSRLNVVCKATLSEWTVRPTQWSPAYCAQSLSFVEQKTTYSAVLDRLPIFTLTIFALQRQNRGIDKCWLDRVREYCGELSKEKFILLNYIALIAFCRLESVSRCKIISFFIFAIRFAAHGGNWLYALVRIHVFQLLGKSMVRKMRKVSGMIGAFHRIPEHARLSTIFQPKNQFFSQ